MEDKPDYTPPLMAPNPPAFPMMFDKESCDFNDGMTLLDYFAAELMSSGNFSVADAYDRAKDMLEERQKYIK